MNILLVEDEAVPALDIKMRLEGFGHNVVAHTALGQKAVELALAKSPDLVLMDIKLKGQMDGIEAARTIREKQATPVVFLTAFSDRATLRRSMEIAPHGYVLKPVNDRDLFATLEAAMIRHRLEEDLQYRLRVEALFADVASRAATAESLEDFLPESLRVIGETMNVDRTYFLEFDPDREVVNNNYEWCAPGIESADEVMNGQPASDGDYFFDLLMEQGRLICRDINNIDNAEARKTLEAQDIRSLVLFPVRVEDEFFGIVGFDDCRSSREWNPDELRTLETMVELLKGLFRRLKSEKRLQSQLKFENVLISISNILINVKPDDIDNTLHRVLGMAAEVLEADRGYIFLFEENGRYYNNTHEWCAEGIEPQIDNMQKRDSHIIRYFYEKLLRNEVFILEDTAALPETAIPEMESFRQQSIKSLVVSPAFFGRRLRGFIGFDSVRDRRNWSELDTGILKIFGEMCLGILERKPVRHTDNPVKHIAG